MIVVWRNDTPWIVTPQLRFVNHQGQMILQQFHIEHTQFQEEKGKSAWFDVPVEEGHERGN